MSTHQDPSGFAEIAEPCSPEVAKLARGARELILSVLPGAHERPEDVEAPALRTLLEAAIHHRVPPPTPEQLP